MVYTNENRRKGERERVSVSLLECIQQKKEKNFQMMLQTSLVDLLDGDSEVKHEIFMCLIWQNVY